MIKILWLFSPLYCASAAKRDVADAADICRFGKLGLFVTFIVSIVQLGPPKALGFSGVTTVSKYQVIERPENAIGGFGWSLDANGSLFAVGAAFSSSQPRQAYIYRDDAPETPSVRLTASDASDVALFGHDISISNDYAVVGSLQDHKSYLFDIHTGNPVRTFTDGRGDAVSVDGNHVALGAVSDSQSRPGAVFLHDAITGQLIRQLGPGGPFGDYAFGVAVTLDRDTLVVGSSGTTKAYVYDAVNGNLRTTLNADELGAFGSALSVDDGRVLVGAPFAHSGSGKAYLFDVNTGEKLLEFNPPDVGNDEWFGRSVYLDGNWALIGSPFTRYGDHSSSGAAYLFNASTGQHVATFYADPAQPTEAFAFSVAITSQHFVFGSGANAPEAIFIASVPEPEAIALMVSGLISVCGELRYSRRNIGRR